MDIKQDIIKRLGPDIIDNDKPSRIRYWPNGNIQYKVWLNEVGLIHRDGNLPAYEVYNDDGRIRGRSWYINNRRIRHEEYDENVSIIESVIERGKNDTRNWWRTLWFNFCSFFKRQRV